MTQSKLTDRLGRPVKHGMHRSPEYIAWQHMKDRCYNPNSQRYDRYGKRGIAVCDRWRNSFEAFYEDVGPRPSQQHSLERVNNDGDYSPENVIWATKEIQDNNKSTSVFLEHAGERLTHSQWSRRIGISANALRARLATGWSVEAAVTTPGQKRNWTQSPGRRTLDADVIVKIRKDAETMTRLAVAERYGVSPTLVLKIVRRVIWKHVA